MVGALGDFVSRTNRRKKRKKGVKDGERGGTKVRVVVKVKRNGE